MILHLATCNRVASWALAILLSWLKSKPSERSHFLSFLRLQHPQSSPDATRQPSRFPGGLLRYKRVPDLVRICISRFFCVFLPSMVFIPTTFFPYLSLPLLLTRGRPARIACPRIQQTFLSSNSWAITALPRSKVRQSDTGGKRIQSFGADGGCVSSITGSIVHLLCDSLLREPFACCWILWLPERFVPTVGEHGCHITSPCTLAGVY